MDEGVMRGGWLIAMGLSAACTTGPEPEVTRVAPSATVSGAAEGALVEGAAVEGAAAEGTAAAGTAEPHDRVAVARLLSGYGGPGVAEAREAHAKACPGARDGRELVGKLAPPWTFAAWSNTSAPPASLASLAGRVVVIRFWTAPSCPYCKKTMPALQALSEELRDEPVTFIGAFHGKPEAAFPTLDKPGEVAEAWGVHFPLAHDRGWKTLSAWWLATGHRHATSVTFVVGSDGRFLHVHPGPVFHPSDKPDEARENQDYLDVVAAIREGIAAAKRGP